MIRERSNLFLPKEKYSSAFELLKIELRCCWASEDRETVLRFELFDFFVFLNAREISISTFFRIFSFLIKFLSAALLKFEFLDKNCFRKVNWSSLQKLKCVFEFLRRTNEHNFGDKIWTFDWVESFTNSLAVNILELILDSGTFFEELIPMIVNFV